MRSKLVLCWNLSVCRSLLRIMRSTLKQKPRSLWRHLIRLTMQLVQMNKRIKPRKKAQLARKANKRWTKISKMMGSLNMSQVLSKRSHNQAKMMKSFQSLSKKQTKSIKTKSKKLKTNFHSLWEKCKTTEFKIGNTANTFKTFWPLTVSIPNNWCTVTSLVWWGTSSNACKTVTPSIKRTLRLFKIFQSV